MRLLSASLEKFQGYLCFVFLSYIPFGSLSPYIAGYSLSQTCKFNLRKFCLTMYIVPPAKIFVEQGLVGLNMLEMRVCD